LGSWRRRRTAAGTAAGRCGGAVRRRCAGRRGDRAAGRSAIATVVDAVYPAGHAGSDLGAVPIDGGTVSAAPAVQATPGWRWAPAGVLAFVALWPAPGYAEGVLALGALAGLARLAASRFRGGIALLSGPAWALTSVLFFAYWLPQLVSALDAVDQGRALREAAVDLRYLPFLWVVASAVAGEQGRRRTFGGLAVIVALWTADALVEAASGT